MKGSSLKSFIGIVTTVALILLSYVVVRSEIKRNTREKIFKQDSLNVKLNRIEAKQVKIQELTSLDRIVRFAADSLGLIRPEKNLEIIQVSKNQIGQIEKILKEKYE
jgi:cell division protein FtsL